MPYLKVFRKFTVNSRLQRQQDDLTHGQASKRVLDRFEEFFTTLDSICEDAFEPELQCYGPNMM